MFSVPGAKFFLLYTFPFQFLNENFRFGLQTYLVISQIANNSNFLKWQTNFVIKGSKSINFVTICNINRLLSEPRCMTVREYNKCVDLYSDYVFRFLLKSLNDEEKAKDIVQDCFERLWIKVDTVRFEKARTYLFTTAYHTMIDGFRKKKYHDEFLKQQSLDPIQNDSYSDLNELLHKLVGQLPEDQRSVILLRDYEGYSYKEISEITGLSETQVKVYIYRGRLFLKERIGKIEAII